MNAYAICLYLRSLFNPDDMEYIKAVDFAEWIYQNHKEDFMYLINTIQPWHYCYEAYRKDIKLIIRKDLYNIGFDCK